MGLWWLRLDEEVRGDGKRVQALLGGRGGIKMINYLIVVMVAQLCAYTKAIRLYTLNELMVWCVDYISIKLL